jgi:hypothetical protein
MEEFNYAIRLGECSNFIEDGKQDGDDKYLSQLCPYGKVGDRLWVKEEHYLIGYWTIDGKTKTGKHKQKFIADVNCHSMFPDNPPMCVCTNRARQSGWWKRNSLFMPRRAARTILEITGVRVERVQEIKLKDIAAEGVRGDTYLGAEWRGKWIHLWDSINGKDKAKCWDANPFVWVVEFEVVS